jgi:KDO2-lipid IV(A) lauroyltransferase
MPLALIKPRHWLWWLGIVLLWCLTRLPYQTQLTVGRQLGRWIYQLAKRRRHIAQTNLKLCFPDLNATQRQQLLYQHFESLGMGVLEMLSAWWLPDKCFQPLWEVHGATHLQAALACGKGVILLSAHFHALEVGGRFATLQTAIHAVYRPHEQPVIEYLFKNSREKHAEKAIPRDQVRDMLRSLKQNKTLWLAIDQNYGHKNSVFAPFFNLPAATNTAISRLAQLSGARVIPFFTQRLDHQHGRYQIVFHPPLAAFPSGNDSQDAEQINQLIEEQIRRAPEQYWWVHRRFKDRPAGTPEVY